MQKRLKDQEKEALEPSSSMTREQLLLEQWRLASELHRHQDTLIWNQFNYFVTFNLALFPIMGIVWSFMKDALYAATFMSLLLTLLGGFICITWRQAHARQRAYHAYRNKQAAEAEAALLVSGKRILTLYEKTVDSQPWFKDQKEWKDAQTGISILISRVTRIMIRLWLFLSVIFLVMFIILLYSFITSI